jgi:uncharacterized membrane protein YdjX (TVP38/TMEM64 family)
MQRARPLLFAGLVALLVWASTSVDLGRHMSRDGMQALLASAGPYGPLLFMAVCVAGIFMHFPEVVLVALGGVALGAPRAFVYGWTACLFGATATFLVVRYLGRDWVQRGLATRFPRLRALDDRLEHHGFRTVLVLRLLLFMAPPLNWALGATRVRLAQYVAGTALGTLPGMATTVYFADAIASRPHGALAPALVVVLAVVLVGTARVVTRRLLLRGT